jgi:cytochrome c oxidase assembly factor CtaG
VSVDELPLALIALALGLHLLGERRVVTRLARPRSTAARWRARSFYAGLALILIALMGPIDSEAPKLLWVHMTQHVMLFSAAPLIVLGAPWMSIWRPLPLELRRALAGTLARSRPLAPLRVVGRSLGRPVAAWIAFNADLLFWHLPFAYDLTLRSEGVHILEHLTFLLFGVLLWAQMIDSSPLRARLRPISRVYYCVAAMLPSWLLSLVLAFATTPLYSAYAHLAPRPEGISALADQQIAAGVMLGPGSLAGTLFVFIGLYRWLGQSADGRQAGRRQYA